MKRLVGWLQVQGQLSACGTWLYRRRKPWKTPNGQVDMRDQGLNLAPPVYQLSAQQHSSRSGAQHEKDSVAFESCANMTLNACMQKTVQIHLFDFFRQKESYRNAILINFNLLKFPVCMTGGYNYVLKYLKPILYIKVKFQNAHSAGNNTFTKT